MDVLETDTEAFMDTSMSSLGSLKDWRNAVDSLCPFRSLLITSRKFQVLRYLASRRKLIRHLYPLGCIFCREYLIFANASFVSADTVVDCLI